MKKALQKNNRNIRHRARLRRSSIVVITLFLSIMGSSAWQIWQLHSQVESQLANLNQEKLSLLQQKKLLQDEIVQLNTPTYIEQLAREQLGLVKHGEILISPKN